MRKNLLEFMITTYDSSRKRFIIRPNTDDISVLNEDVYDIFELRNEGDDVISMIATVQLGMATGRSYDDDFVRRVVLVLLGTVLAPQSTKFVPYRYYKMVEDVNAIKSYNWNDFMLGVCMDAIKKSVEDLEKFKWPIGNLALLQKRKGKSETTMTTCTGVAPAILKTALAKSTDVLRLNTDGVLYKPNKRDNNDEFDNVGERVGMENGQYKSLKYWPDIDSPTDVKIETSFTGINDTSVPVDDTGAPATTPGKGEATDHFIIDDNGNSPSLASTVRTKDCPSLSRTPQNADISGESMDALSPTKSEDTFESYPAESNIGNGEGSQENDGKRKRKKSKYCQSPYDILVTRKKRVKKIINAYFKHLQHRDFSDRYISTTWFPKFMLSRARGKTKSVNDLDSEHVTKKTKFITRVMDEYFRRDKAYFPMDVNDNHWITIVMHTVKEEFQVLDSNSKGAISQRIRNMITTLANSTLESKKIPDVSTWPINEYKMPRQKDGVSCGLFVMWCIKYWDGDRWTHEFDQEQINESRPRIVAEIIFSEVNKLEKVKMKIVKIMEKE
ncbi:unnamed protein product [Triticum turgidum subsp. durum]|uniref:Ubiquitin-like protease family profile domain-containing protein n=1 Tax=Triticum turgidum subsp. durum TaxID=4567 RepID=A0A9R1QY82_TRITD|nr:unnamed protein product [Triticum turgidum subsp. durum]